MHRFWPGGAGLNLMEYHDDFCQHISDVWKINLSEDKYLVLLGVLFLWFFLYCTVLFNLFHCYCIFQAWDLLATASLHVLSIQIQYLTQSKLFFNSIISTVELKGSHLYTFWLWIWPFSWIFWSLHAWFRWHYSPLLMFCYYFSLLCYPALL